MPLAGEQGVQSLAGCREDGRRACGAAAGRIPVRSQITGKRTARKANGSDTDVDKIRNEKDLEATKSFCGRGLHGKSSARPTRTRSSSPGAVLSAAQPRGLRAARDGKCTRVGRRRVVRCERCVERKGSSWSRPSCSSTVTGTRLHRESYRKEVLYPSSQNTPALSSYFELMDQVIPEFLEALSTTKIRGSRVLLK